MTIRSVSVGLLLWLSCGVATAQVTSYSCQALGGTNCTARIPDSPQAGIVSTMQIPAAAAGVCNTPATVSVQLNIVHNWIGDLQATVSNPSATSATLINSLAGAGVGGCQGSDINAAFRDGAGTPTCSGLIPSVGGTVGPVSPLAPLVLAHGVPPGTWTLNLADTGNDHDGALIDWSVQVTCAASAIPATSPTANLWIVLLLALFAVVALSRSRGLIQG